MTLAKHCRNAALMTLLLAATAMGIVEARAEQDTFLEGPGDTFYIDQDNPDQDPKYDTDDPKYDEMDDLDHDEDDEGGYDRQSFVPPHQRLETFWI